VSLPATGVLLAVLGVALMPGPQAVRAQQSGSQQGGQEEISRKVKNKVAPLYPDLARKMSITGTVKVEIVVSPNGTVKEARIVGGHPVLANASLEAVKKWRFEPAAEETTGMVNFRFEAAH